MQHHAYIARQRGKINYFVFVHTKSLLKTAFRRDYAILILYLLRVRVHYFSTWVTSICKRAPKSLFWAPTWVPSFEYLP